MSSTSSQWQVEFDRVTKTPPPPGAILTTLDGSPLAVHIEFPQGKAPFMYALAHVPCIVGCQLGWFARSVDEESMYGWKVILLPKARDKVIQRIGIARNKVGVGSIRIIRASHAGKSLLGEIVDFTAKRVPQAAMEAVDKAIATAVQENEVQPRGEGLVDVPQPAEA